MTKEQLLKDYLLENTDEVRSIVSELNSWNGCLENLQVYENDEEFFNTFFSDNPMEAVRACCYGEYSYNDDYVRLNGYGNLESLSEYDLEQEMKDSIDEIIENLIENSSHVCLSDEIEEILNDEEEEEEEEEEENISEIQKDMIELRKKHIRNEAPWILGE